MLNYEEMILPKMTRSMESNPKCHCSICLTDKSHGKNKHISSDFIDDITGLVGSSNSVTILPPKPEEKKKKSLSMYTNCKQEIGPGINHQCSVAQPSSHIVDHVQTLPDMTAESSNN